MAIRTSLSKDPKSAALNSKAHASEHCAIDEESLRVLGSAVGRQLLIRRSAKRLALYTVAERIDVAGRAAHAGTVGIARVEAAAGDAPVRASLETEFLGGDAQVPARLTEQVLG